MRFLLLNQTFYPDVAATAQYLSDVARALADQGHQVSVVTGTNSYGGSDALFRKHEVWRGIEIHRVWGTRLGKTARWRRIFDFASFMLACCARLIRVPRPDVIVALTSPPLISFLAACYAMLRRCRFVYWVMDLNPDEAIAAGWLRESSLVARILERLSAFGLRRADAVVVLDRFMERRILQKGIVPEKVFVLPLWSHDDAVHFDEPARDEFRRQHGLGGRFVVMYSGNHSPCHPLDALLRAALAFKEASQIVFCFVGGGSEFPKVQRFASENGLRNFLCLPYQPLVRLAGSLSAADLHVVVMGDEFVGTIHPCKIYNMMRVAPAILYIGPEASHIADAFRNSGQNFLTARNGDSDSIVRAIREARANTAERPAFLSLAASYAQTRLVPQLVSILEAAPLVQCSVAEKVPLSREHLS